MFRKALLVAAIAFAGVVQAQIPEGVIVNGQGSATISWTPSTTWEGGAAMAAADRSGVVIFFGPASRFSSGTTLRSGCAARPASLTETSCYPSRFVVANGATVTTPVSVPLTQEAVISFAAVTTATNGSWSNFSNEGAKRFRLTVTDTRLPGAPVLTTINITVSCTTNLPAYTCQFTVSDP